MCKSRSGLTQHTKSAHRAAYERERIYIERVRIKRRLRPSMGRKMAILRIVDNNPGWSRGDIGYLCGLKLSCAKNQICKWLGLRRTNVVAWGKDKSAKILQVVERCAKFKDAERELNKRFLHRRRKKGLYVDGEWLKKEMKKILRCYRPQGYESFKYSKGWLWRFCTRFRISSQAKTDQKTESSEFRISKIKAVMREYYPTLPYPTLPYPILPYSTLPYPGPPQLDGGVRTQQQHGGDSLPGRRLPPC